MFVTTVIKCHSLSYDIFNANLTLKTLTGYDVMVYVKMSYLILKYDVIFALKMSLNDSS